MEKVAAYIGLGSNLGDRREYIQKALDLLAHQEGVQLDRVSSVIETAPIGKVDQPQFLNCVAGVSTTLGPNELLASCLQVEQSLGRVRRERWGPRTIDLDVLLYGNKAIQNDVLTVPHPEIKNRPFVQEGLRELGAYD